MKKPDFEQMTTKELAELYKSSRQEFIRQRDQQSQAQRDFGIGDTYYKDDFGNVIDGVRPPKKEYRHYVDDAGYVRELAPGESAPDNLLGPGATGAERLTHFVNQHLNDAEIAELLPQDEHVVLGEYHDYSIAGSFANDGWHIRAIDEVGNAPEIRFRMSAKYDQDEALAHAKNYVKNFIATSVRELPESEINFIQRLAADNRELAVGLYLKSRLPSRYEKQLDRLVAEIEQTGSNVELLRFMSHPDVNDVASEAVSAVWRWSQPHLDFTPELEEFIQQRTAGNILSFVLLDRLLKQFHLGRQVALAASPSVGERQLNELSDDEVSDLFNRTRVEVARSRK